MNDGHPAEDSLELALRAPARCAIYLRISLDRDGDEKAVDRQRRDARDLAGHRRWDIVGEYVDNSVSASKANVVRPEYERMLADYQLGRFDAIICYDLDRLTRQPRQLEDWIDHAEKRGLTLVTLNGEADLSTDGGRMYARIKAAVARAEVERKGARQKRANLQRAEQGHWQFSRRPYGYERVGGVIRVVEAEAEIVREGYRRYLSGDTYYAIASDWNRRGVPTFSGNWSMQRVRQLLRNPRYAGIVEHNGRTYEVAPSSIRWEPLIDERTWTDYVSTRDGRKRAGSWSTSTKHLLSGLLTCEACGSRLLARPEYRRTSDGTRTQFQSYQCTDNWCVYVRADQADEFIDSVVIARLSDPRITRALRKTPNTEPVRREITEVKLRRDRIVDLLAEGLIDRRKAREQAEILTNRLTELTSRLASFQRQSPLTDLAGKKNIAVRWSSLSVLERRRVIEELGLRAAVRKAGKGRRPAGPDGKPVFDSERFMVTWS
jgi:DNA invertase Pin-like site-specific DNA recombinase